MNTCPERAQSLIGNTWKCIMFGKVCLLGTFQPINLHWQIDFYVYDLHYVYMSHPGVLLACSTTSTLDFAIIKIWIHFIDLKFQYPRLNADDLWLNCHFIFLWLPIACDDYVNEINTAKNGRKVALNTGCFIV